MFVTFKKECRDLILLASSFSIGINVDDNIFN